MMILAVTAITNFILACEVFFLSGMLVKTTKTTYSALWFWSAAMFLLGTSALLGGIDHGFLEPLGPSARSPLKEFNWMVLGVMTFCTLMTTARQFLPSKLCKSVLIIGILQFALLATLIFVVDKFIVVILNYAAVLFLLLIYNFLGLKDGRGSWPMIVGIIVLVIASIIQMMTIVLFGVLDENSLYYLISLVGVVFLYFGGQRLKSTI